MSVRSGCKTIFFQLHSGTLSVNYCRLSDKVETIEHIILDCWDAIFHWEILQKTLKKDLPLPPFGIRLYPTENEGGVPYDMFMLLSWHSL